MIISKYTYVFALANTLSSVLFTIEKKVEYLVCFSQVLVTKPDFYNENTRKNLFCTLSELISLNIGE